MDNDDFPHDYFTNFGAIICNLIAFIFPGYITKPLVKFLAGILLPPDIPIEEKLWLTDEYLPEIVKATSGNKIPFKYRLDLGTKVIGVAIKLIYAFTYQEQFLPIPGFETHPIIYLGGLSIPIVTGLADSLTGFK